MFLWINMFFCLNIDLMKGFPVIISIGIKRAVHGNCLFIFTDDSWAKSLIELVTASILWTFSKLKSFWKKTLMTLCNSAIRLRSISSRTDLYTFDEITSPLKLLSSIIPRRCLLTGIKTIVYLFQLIFFSLCFFLLLFIYFKGKIWENIIRASDFHSILSQLHCFPHIDSTCWRNWINNK